MVGHKGRNKKDKIQTKKPYRFFFFPFVSLSLSRVVVSYPSNGCDARKQSEVGCGPNGVDGAGDGGAGGEEGVGVDAESSTKAIWWMVQKNKRA